MPVYDGLIEHDVKTRPLDRQPSRRVWTCERMKRRVGPVEHLYGQAARQSSQQVHGVVRETVSAHGCAECVQNSRGFEEAHWPADVLHVNNQLAQPPARKQIVQFARMGAFLASRYAIDRMVADQMYFVMGFRVFHPHEFGAARIKKLVGDGRRPIRARFERHGARFGIHLAHGGDTFQVVRKGSADPHLHGTIVVLPVHLRLGDQLGGRFVQPQGTRITIKAVAPRRAAPQIGARHARLFAGEIPRSQTDCTGG